MNLELDDALKIVQICFYVVAGVVAILTYRAAKRSLLNTVNTEYQKHVIERLKELSAELASEFDPESENYWARESPVQKATGILNERYLESKEKILEAGKFFPPGVPVGDDEQRLRVLGQQTKSDPFLPKKIRDEISDLVEQRRRILMSVRMKHFQQYMDGLAAGKYPDETLEMNFAWISNQIGEDLRNQGCGLGQIDEEIHQIRLKIQDHFEAFNPLT